MGVGGRVLGAQLLAEGAGLRLDRLLDPRLLDGPREQRRRELVVARRQADGDLALGPPVEPRRPAGAGAAATGRAPRRDLQQPLLRQPVEVEGRHRAGDADRRGRIRPRDLAAGGRDVVVQRAADGVGQGRDGVDGIAHGADDGRRRARGAG